MKANKKTLMVVKQYLQNQEGWDLSELIPDWIAETKLLAHKEMGHVEADECEIRWDNDYLCNLLDFANSYTQILIQDFCKVLDSFVDEDLSCYEFDENN